MNLILPATTLCKREIVRFYRQRSRVIGAIVPPILFWALIGSGFSGSFRHPLDLTYLQYFFPGTVVMVVLFTAIFSTISIIEDRREGFLQSVLVAPVPRSAIVLGKIMGGSVLAFMQGAVLILLAPAIGARFDPMALLYVLTVLFIVAFGLTGLGFAIAWRMDSTQGFHAVMNVFLMPMWFLSGSIFPMEGAPGWLRWTMTINPLTYGVAALRQGLYSSATAANGFPSPTVCIAASALFATAMFALSVLVCRSRVKQ